MRQELTEVKAWRVDRKIPGLREEGLEQTWVEKQPFLFWIQHVLFNDVCLSMEHSRIISL